MKKKMFKFLRLFIVFVRSSWLFHNFGVEDLVLTNNTYTNNTVSSWCCTDVIISISYDARFVIYHGEDPEHVHCTSTSMFTLKSLSFRSLLDSWFWRDRVQRAMALFKHFVNSSCLNYAIKINLTWLIYNLIISCNAFVVHVQIAQGGSRLDCSVPHRAVYPASDGWVKLSPFITSWGPQRVKSRTQFNHTDLRDGATAADGWTDHDFIWNNRSLNADIKEEKKTDCKCKV